MTTPAQQPPRGYVTEADAKLAIMRVARLGSIATDALRYASLFAEGGGTASLATIDDVTRELIGWLDEGGFTIGGTFHPVPAPAVAGGLRTLLLRLSLNVPLTGHGELKALVVAECARPEPSAFTPYFIGTHNKREDRPNA